MMIEKEFTMPLILLIKTSLHTFDFFKNNQYLY